MLRRLRTVRARPRPGGARRLRAPAVGLLAISCLAALTGCGGSAAKGPTVVIGSKEFTEQWIIGELYKQVLASAGYRVELKSNIGSTNIIDGALTSGQIDLYPEYTGVILQVLAGDTSVPHSAAETYRKARKYEQTRGLTLLKATPFQNRDAVAVKPALAKKYGLKTIGDLNKVHKPGGLSFGEYPDNMEGGLGFRSLVEAYHLHDIEARTLNIGLQYPALDHGQVDAADVFTTDPQLARGDYTLLKDDKSFYGFQNVAPVVRRSVLADQGPGFGRLLDRVDALLTDRAVREMNRGVDTVRLAPSEVAARFLRANGLI